MFLMLGTILHMLSVTWRTQLCKPVFPYCFVQGSIFVPSPSTDAPGDACQSCWDFFDDVWRCEYEWAQWLLEISRSAALKNQVEGSRRVWSGQQRKTFADEEVVDEQAVEWLVDRRFEILNEKEMRRACGLKRLPRRLLGAVTSQAPAEDGSGLEKVWRFACPEFPNCIGTLRTKVGGNKTIKKLGPKKQARQAQAQIVFKQLVQQQRDDSQGGVATRPLMTLDEFSSKNKLGSGHRATKVGVEPGCGDKSDDDTNAGSASDDAASSSSSDSEEGSGDNEAVLGEERLNGTASQDKDECQRIIDSVFAEAHCEAKDSRDATQAKEDRVATPKKRAKSGVAPSGAGAAAAISPARSTISETDAAGWARYACAIMLRCKDVVLCWECIARAFICFLCVLP